MIEDISVRVSEFGEVEELKEIFAEFLILVLLV